MTAQRHGDPRARWRALRPPLVSVAERQPRPNQPSWPPKRHTNRNLNRIVRKPFQGRRAESPNDRKLSDTPERRGTCMEGGKAAVEAGAVTRRRVRCSAWLGDVGGCNNSFEVFKGIAKCFCILCV